MNSKVDVKKVKAFPFPISLKIGANTLAGKVLNMNQVGFMIETNSGLIATGDKVEAEFTLPVMNQVVICNGIVVKLYNQSGGLRIAEIHFKGLTEGVKEKILHYLTAAGTKP